MTQADLFSAQPYPQAQPIQFLPKKKTDFQPVVLTTAPDEVLAMPESTLREKVLKAVAVLKWVMQRYEICYSYSGGKDSSTVLAMGLAAAAQLKAEGREVKRFLILNSDTQVENPEVLGVVRAELERVRRWIAGHNLPGHIEVTEPYILSQWAVSIIGGKTLISTPLTSRNCTSDLKSIPLTRVRKQFFGQNRIAEGKFMVGVTGVRFDESAERAGNMMKRAESPVQLVQTNADQDVFLAPIANWTTDDVMEFLGLAVNRAVLPEDERLPISTYSDMADVWRIYKDAEGECTVGSGGGPSKGCGARHGCYVCGMVTNDKSMDAFVTQEQYSYMEPLARFRTYITNTLFDHSKRTWIGRTINDGHIVYGPDAYSPEYVQDLLRYALTIDRNEARAARQLGISPRFQIVSARALVAIDAMWSLQAYTLPFAALAIYDDVYVKGLSFEVPVVEKSPVIPVPPRRYIPVHDWDEDAADAYTGLRHAVLEATEGPCTALREIQVKGTPTLVMEPEVGRMFDVHEESVAMILEFELDRLVARHHESARRAGEIGFGLVGEGYKFYVQFGAITLAKSQVGEVDSILRRSHWREQHGLSGYNYDRDRAYAMTVEAPVPLEPRKVGAKKSDAELREARRLARRNEVACRRISLAQLYRDWSPDVPWRELGHQRLPTRRLLAHCLQKGNARYSAGVARGWARHHFVRLGELVRFLKDHPQVAEAVKVHRSTARRRGVQQLLAA
jgi:3'-phosphoadenosine 5'-phosphosulfate sulfotransferase (PAPS reductase)/FAD synthetase